MKPPVWLLYLGFILPLVFLVWGTWDLWQEAKWEPWP